jgi:hypothetical protein
VNLQSLLRHVFANCNDFKDKETALGWVLGHSAWCEWKAHT